MGILIALTSSFFTALGNIFLKKAYKNFSPFASFVVFSLMCIVIWPIGGQFLKFDASMIVPGLIYGAVSALLAQGFYIYTLSKGELSITGTLIATYPIFTVLLSSVINHETLQPIGYIAVSAVIAGTIIVALPEKTTTAQKVKSSLIFLALATAAAVGASDALSKQFINTGGAGTFLTATALMQIPISAICMALTGGKKTELTDVLKQPRNYRNAILGTLCLSLSTFLLFMSFDYAPASLVSPILGTYPALTVVLAYFVLREKITRKNLVGIVIVIVGILAASF
jgi:transporter family protein